ncbi:MAG: hypothetical protein ACI31G_04515 [Bacilli bacterium]
MKKTILCLLPSLMILSACTKDNKTLITFGSDFDTSATKITYDDLKIKIIDEQSFVLAIYPGENSTCGCWTQFSGVIDDYVKQNSTIIYKINYELLDSETNRYGLTYYSDRPTLALFEKGKLKKEWQYVTKNIDPLFKSTIQLEKTLKEVIFEPKLIYINQEQLDEKIANDNFTVCYVWASCPDCQFAMPNVVIPYYEDNLNDEQLYLFDCEIEGILLEDGIKNSSNENYTKFKNDYKLSTEGDSVFGYATGYVPTFQRYENGNLKSALTYLNDAVSVNEQGNYYISRSFFTSERLEDLEYLNNFNGTKIIEGIEVSEDDLIFNSDRTRYSWDKEKANVYHKPLLEKFLSYYQK